MNFDQLLHILHYTFIQCFLNQAIAEDPNDAVQWHQLGLHSLCTQEFKTSQSYLKAAVARLNECGYAWSNLGNQTVYVSLNSISYRYVF